MADDRKGPGAPPRAALHVVGAALVVDGRCLAVQRSALMRSPLEWEFPGGKVEAGESAVEALVREVSEELGLAIEVGEFLARGTFEAPWRLIELDVYLARLRGGELELREHQAARWLTADELGSVDWAKPDLPAVARLKELLAGAPNPWLKAGSWRTG